MLREIDCPVYYTSGRLTARYIIPQVIDYYTLSGILHTKEDWLPGELHPRKIDSWSCSLNDKTNTVGKDYKIETFMLHNFIIGEPIKFYLCYQSALTIDRYFIIWCDESLLQTRSICRCWWRPGQGRGCCRAASAATPGTRCSTRISLSSGTWQTYDRKWLETQKSMCIRDKVFARKEYKM